MSSEMFSLDRERAIKVFGRLNEAYTKKEKIFSWPDVFPEKQLTKYFKTDSLEFRLLLFLLVCFDHNIQSQSLYHKIAKSIENKFIEDPKKMLYFDEKATVELLFGRLGLPFPRYKKAFMKNIETLRTKYSGDPLNIIKGAHDINEAKKLISNDFAEYAEQMPALLLTFYEKYGVTKFQNGHSLEAKIDLNKLRVLHETNILNPLPGYESGEIHKDNIIPTVIRFLSQVCTENGFNASDITEGAWAIGKYISSVNKINLFKRMAFFDYANPLASFSDPMRMVEMPFGMKTIMKKNVRGDHFQGSHLYFYKLNPPLELSMKGYVPLAKL
ncbi:MAG: hypothetical protein V1866_01755 [archaeon]